LDSAVALVQTYLRVNGYFTVTEYPIVEAAGEFKAATDLDVMAVRFPHSTRLVPGSRPSDQRRHPPFVVDPRLGVGSEHTDMLVGEVKEGKAEFNRSGLRLSVLTAALARFGCCPPDESEGIARRLLQNGHAVTPGMHTVRLVAFGSRAGSHAPGPHGEADPYLRIPLGHVVSFLEGWIESHWEVLRHAPSRDPGLAFLTTIMKARRTI